MIAQPSPLVIHNFFILKKNFQYVPLAEGITREDVLNHPVDIDFTLKKVKDGFNLFVKLSHNYSEDALAGYSFFIEAVGVFSLQTEKILSEKMIQNLQYVSTLSLVINFLRGYLLNVTSYCPLGPFVLPAIDLNELMKSKTGKKPSGSRPKNIDENSRS